MEDTSNNAPGWCEAIDEVKNFTFKDDDNSNGSTTAAAAAGSGGAGSGGTSKTTTGTANNGFKTATANKKTSKNNLFNLNIKNKTSISDNN